MRRGSPSSVLVMFTVGMVQFSSVVCFTVLPDLPEVHRVRDIRLLVRLPAEQDPLPVPTVLVDLEVCEMFVLVQAGGPQQVSLLDPPHPALLAQPGDAARPSTGPAGLVLVLPATGTSHDCSQSVSEVSALTDTNCMEISGQFTTSSTPGRGQRRVVVRPRGHI